LSYFSYQERLSLVMAWTRSDGERWVFTRRARPSVLEPPDFTQKEWEIK